MNIVHFYNGLGGGVLSCIKNLIRFSQHKDIYHNVVCAINKDKKISYIIPDIPGAEKVSVFNYSAKWNFYYTCRELAKLLPGDDAVIVAHDWLELGMITNLGLNYPVVHFLHGDYEYYYQLAERHKKWIDSFICVSASIADNLKKRMPERVADIHYLRFPVPEIKNAREDSSTLQLVFVGRCEEAKGYHILPMIDAALQQKNIHARWHIAGVGSDQPEVQQQWKQTQVHFYGNMPQNELTGLLSTATAFVLPSLAEGMPISLVEAMKAGAIPVVNDLKGGLQELVTNDVTGYRIPNNDPLIFAERLAAIATNECKKNQLSAAAISFANSHFNPVQNTKLIEDLFMQAFKQTKSNEAFKITGSRLDQPFLPNFMVTIIRSIIG